MSVNELGNSSPHFTKSAQYQICDSRTSMHQQNLIKIAIPNKLQFLSFTEKKLKCDVDFTTTREKLGMQKGRSFQYLVKWLDMTCGTVFTGIQVLCLHGNPIWRELAAPMRQGPGKLVMARYLLCHLEGCLAAQQKWNAEAPMRGEVYVSRWPLVPPTLLRHRMCGVTYFSILHFPAARNLVLQETKVACI